MMEGLGNLKPRKAGSSAAARITLLLRTIKMNTIPVIHCISNIVTANDCANLLLAAGFSPVMAEEPLEMEEFAAAADALVINLGTPSERKYEAAASAGKAYNRLGKPVVVDPVGIAASAYRRDRFRNLMKEFHPDVIRCNLNEALSLIRLMQDGQETASGYSGALEGADPCGIDSRENADTGKVKAPEAAKELAGIMNCVVLISGAADAVSDGNRLRLIEGGSDLIKQVTGSGCMLSALTGGFCAGAADLFEAAANASARYKRIAEAAEASLTESGRTGELRMRLIDCARQERRE